MLKTRLTEFLQIDHPILQAPMAFAAGGALASAVTQAGGLGFIGGGYGDAEWLKREFSNAGNTHVGCGFITWCLKEQPALLTQALVRHPKAIFLSFDDPAPFVPEIQAAGIPLICQIQTLKDAKHAIDLGAKIIAAQGAEAGGHGESRATFTLVPEIADYIAQYSPDTILVAAGGIADGRGLAASLMLGADGVLIGSRFWAAKEALVHPAFHAAALAANGDHTLRSKVIDIARNKSWADRYTCRILQNAFSDRWHGDEKTLQTNAKAHQSWNQALASGDADQANAIVGEAVGLIHDIQPAKDIVQAVVQSAEERLKLYS